MRIHCWEVDTLFHQIVISLTRKLINCRLSLYLVNVFEDLIAMYSRVPLFLRSVRWEISVIVVCTFYEQFNLQAKSVSIQYLCQKVRCLRG